MSLTIDGFIIDGPNPIAERMVAVELPASLCVAVGSTLRMLARTSPCGDALERVGTAMVNAARPRLRVRGERGCI